MQLLNAIMRIPGVPIVPTFVANKLQNSVTVRGTAPLVAIMEQLVQANDRPRAEIVVDVQILEVNRTRAKQSGLDLSQYTIGGIFSPEVAPEVDTSSDGGTTITTQPFNLNTISTGVSSGSSSSGKSAATAACTFARCSDSFSRSSSGTSVISQT